MAFGGSSKGIKNEINVTPLVDVVLVLLIIFMVVMPMLEQGATVTLPKAKVIDKSEKSDALVISVPADKSIWVEGQQISGPELRSKIAAAIGASSQRKLLVKGDTTLTVGAVRAVVAEAQKAGAKGISLAVEEQK